MINNTTITNIYNNFASGNDVVTQSGCVSRAIAGAVTAVPGEVFTNTSGGCASRGDHRSTCAQQRRDLAHCVGRTEQRSMFGAAKASDVRPSAPRWNAVSGATRRRRVKLFAEREGVI